MTYDAEIAIDPPLFDDGFHKQFVNLMAWRRDVRRFLRKPVPQPLIDHLLDMVQLSPSVGLSQPWRWVGISSDAARAAVQKNFAECNARTLANYHGKAARLYAELKLQGFDQAPLQYAVFCDPETAQGAGLGSRTMREALDYSVCGMVTNFWLYARSFGLGVGWVSIIDPDEVKKILSVPDNWKLIAVLCVGWPEEEHVDPELERHGWQLRTTAGRVVLER